MYYRLSSAVSKAIDLLIQAERETEELYMSADDVILTLVPKAPHQDQEQEEDRH